VILHGHLKLTATMEARTVPCENAGSIVCQLTDPSLFRDCFQWTGVSLQDVRTISRPLIDRVAVEDVSGVPEIAGCPTVEEGQQLQQHERLWARYQQRQTADILNPGGGEGLGEPGGVEHTGGPPKGQGTWRSLNGATGDHVDLHPGLNMTQPQLGPVDLEVWMACAQEGIKRQPVLHLNGDIGIPGLSGRATDGRRQAERTGERADQQ